MNRSKQSFIGLAALCAGAYLFLAVTSVACVIDHAEARPSNHHHGSAVSHSSFCAWACQSNPTSDAGPAAPLFHPFLVVAFFVESSHIVVAGGGLFYTASRAPPLQS